MYISILKGSPPVESMNPSSSYLPASAWHYGPPQSMPSHLAKGSSCNFLLRIPSSMEAPRSYYASGTRHQASGISQWEGKCLNILTCWEGYLWGAVRKADVLAASNGKEPPSPMSVTQSLTRWALVSFSSSIPSLPFWRFRDHLPNQWLTHNPYLSVYFCGKYPKIM